MKNQTITRAGLKELYEIACPDWERKIERLIKNQSIFAEEFEVEDELLLDAYAAADMGQVKLLNKYFTKPVKLFTADMLKEGEMMILTEYGEYEGHTLLRTYELS